MCSPPQKTCAQSRYLAARATETFLASKYVAALVGFLVAMNRKSMQSKRTRALIAGPALALALAGCSGGESELATTTAPAAAAFDEPATASAAPTSPEETRSPDPTAAETPASDPTATARAAETELTDDVAPTETAEAPAPTEVQAPVVERLSADVAIANASANIGNLTPAENATNVLDIEVLAVGDGSIQTLRDVVVGDRPVLLWFFSPH